MKKALATLYGFGEVIKFQASVWSGWHEVYPLTREKNSEQNNFLVFANARCFCSQPKGSVCLKNSINYRIMKNRY